MPGLNMTGLPSKLKDYTVKEQAKLLSRILISGLSFLDYMELFDEVTDELPLTEMFVDSVLQPGGKDTFTPKGSANFKARMGKVRSCKVDFKLTPTQITAMWKSYVGKINKSTRESVYDVPFQQFIVDKITEKLKNDLQLAAVFKGVYNPEGTGAADVFDGILAKLKVAGVLPAGNIAAGTAMSDANAIAQFEKVADLVPAEYVNEDLVAIVNPNFAKYYNRDYRNTYGANTNAKDGFTKTKLEGTNIEIISEPGLAGTNGLIITPRNNAVWLCDSMRKTDAFIIEKSQRNIELMVDFEAASDVAIAELVWTNDLTLA
jgi:hypothetical protein